MKFNRLPHIKTLLTLIILTLAFLLPSVDISAIGNSLSVSSEAAISASASASAAARKKGGSRKKRKSGRNRKSRNKKKKSSSSRKKTTSSKRWSNASAPAPEAPSYDSLTLLINKAVIARIPENQNPGGLRVNSVKTDTRNRTAKLSLNENFTYLPVTHELINDLRHAATEALPDSLKDYSLSLSVGNHNLAYYITKVDPLPEKYRKNVPFVVAKEPYVNPKKGMEGDIVALWHSHGRYYRPGSGGWMWQRPVLFETIEDIFPMAYILPYTVPMLENAGAYVMLPRERDINRNEVIVDNDVNPDGGIYSQTSYKEMNGARRWETGEGEGFIYDLPDFRDTENPFENGTYRQVSTVKSGKPSVAAWYADIPEDGEYAVYVSYKTLPNSTDDAHYTVNYSGGTREFTVNQTMGGGTWIYLGTFPLEAGYSDSEPIVTLSNLSEHSAEKVVTADAVKIGGGMGNIARSPRRSDIYYDPSTPVETASVSSKNQQQTVNSDEEDDEEDDDESDDEEDDESDEGTDENGNIDNSTVAEEKQAEPVKKGPAPSFRTSGLPRYLEGARYWLQWAGFPESVYSPYHGSDDYKDDYTSRGKWVNYLAGGSRVLPGREGLGIPVDVTMALHTDAGKRSDDSFVGTLGIYFTNGGDSYADGTPRINSRMLTDMLMRQITGDIRQTYEPRWTRRSMWDKTYVEARVPEVPTALIELMSHQNFGDMQYGLDPGFRFTVGRAIYKALARFIGERKKREVVIQPLPVKDFAITRNKRDHYRLSWAPTPDPLEPTAMPQKYIIFERSGDELGFHKIGETHSTHYDVKTNDTDIHSFKIVAANEGGLSFPSEILAFRESERDEKPVLIVNGFTRVSGPGHFSDEGRAGFDSENDFGVPYIRDISFSGYQTEFRRSAGESFGRSGQNMVSQVIAGNTFDFPYIHGEAIQASGKGFVSASVGAVTAGNVNLSDYKIVDLILGKQKTTVVGNGKSGRQFEAFPVKLREQLAAFTKKGGRIFASGQNLASDLADYRSGSEAVPFGQKVFGVELDSVQSRSRSGKIQSVGGAMRSDIMPRTYGYSSTLNQKQYIVERADVLKAAPGADADVFMTFTDNDLPAGILSRNGKSRTAVMSIPFESLTDGNQRILLMKEILDYLDN